MREPKLGVAVGRKGVGKTHLTKKVINEYIFGNPSAGVAPRRFLILDVNDEFTDIKALDLKDIRKFSIHPTIEARRIRPFHKDGRRMTLVDYQHTLFKTLEQYRGGGLLIEDINKYISDNLPNDVIGAICTNRHTDTDIILHFQSIGRISPKIWQNLNWIRFHKITDSVDRNRNKFEDKYELLRLAEILVDLQYYHPTNPNKRYYLYVDVDEQKLRGDISQENMMAAVETFLTDPSNYNKLVRPLLNRINLTGKGKKHTPETALKEVKDHLLTKYLN
jgi:hypothetical protein